ncbi:MAG: Fic family protein [Ferruginibacter sp.]
MDLKIIKTDLLAEYLEQVPKNLQEAFDALHDAEISTENFSFYTSVASVFSGKLEGVEIELDSYIKHKKFGIEFLPDYTKKTDDLYNAYIFAQSNKLSQVTISQAHKLLSKHIVKESWQGVYRNNNMYVSTPDGKIEYVAASPFELKQEMEKFFDDLEILLRQEMTIEEIFYSASLIHLVFVKIHPWNDGNGRSARLIEKWFLAEKLGRKSWLMQSEKKYYHNHQFYYKNLRALGLEYVELDYSKSLPFLLMLAQSLENN